MRLLTVDEMYILKNKIMELQNSDLDGIRDINKLDSIIAQQNQEVFGTVLYPTVFDKAAFLWCSFSFSHAFIDGNKRIAFITMLMTLQLNGVQLELSHQDYIYDTCIKIITDHLSVSDVSSIIEKNSFTTKQTTFNSAHDVVFNSQHVLTLLERLSR